MRPGRPPCLPFRPFPHTGAGSASDGYGNPPPPDGAQPAASPVRTPRYNVLAIVSLVSAFFLSLVAVITGHMALGQIKRTAEKGRGLADHRPGPRLPGILGGTSDLRPAIVMAIAGIGLFATIANNYDPDDYTTRPIPSASTAAPDCSAET